MTFQRCYNNKGVVLVDILLAITLSSVFILTLAESNSSAREIFVRARERNELLDAFEDGTGTTTAKMFGNERIETIMTTQGTTSNPLTVSFVAVRNIPFSSNEEVAGTPLCSVDFTSREVVGSYGYIRGIGNSTSSNSVVMNSIRIKPITLPIDPLLPLTDIELRNNIAYVSTDSTTASDPDLFIFDIADSTNPILLSSINTGPGISSVALAGQRVYAAAASTAAQLHIIRLDNLGQLTVEKKFRLPLPYATATPPFGSSIFFDGGIVYLGTEKWDGSELLAIDISDPINPQVIGEYEADSKVNGIFIDNGTAYVAASNEKQLHLIDINDSTNLISLDYFSPSGWERQEGKVASLFENSLSFGRTSGGFNIIGDHELFARPAVSSTSPPSLFDSSGTDSIDMSGGVYGIVADRRHLYLATRVPDQELVVTDKDLNILDTYSLPIAPQTITCDGARLYILAHSAPIIYEISF